MSVSPSISRNSLNCMNKSQKSSGSESTISSSLFYTQTKPSGSKSNVSQSSTCDHFSIHHAKINPSNIEFSLFKYPEVISFLKTDLMTKDMVLEIFDFNNPDDKKKFLALTKNEGQIILKDKLLSLEEIKNVDQNKFELLMTKAGIDALRLCHDPEKLITLDQIKKIDIGHLMYILQTDGILAIKKRIVTLDELGKYDPCYTSIALRDEGLTNLIRLRNVGITYSDIAVLGYNKLNFVLNQSFVVNALIQGKVKFLQIKDLDNDIVMTVNMESAFNPTLLDDYLSKLFK